MMKPYLVESIESGGVIASKIGPSELTGAICTEAVADTLMRALRAVSEDGTAKVNLNGVKCSVAGKTGTSFGTFNIGGKVRYENAEGKKKYNGTFVGFFPADKNSRPEYSIICTVFSSPTVKQYQGGGIPARVTRTVVNSLYDIDPCFRETLQRKKK